MFKIVFFLLLSVTAVGQSYTGTKTPYPFKQGEYTPLPKGYTAAYVNYTGRHGARFMTKAGSDVKLLALFNKSQLTPLGDSVKVMTEAFLQIEKDNYENISLLGDAEQHAIGERLRKREATAFKGRGVTIEVTHKKRTRQSADGFLKAFADYKGKQEFMMVQDTNENVLRFYDLSPAYEAYKDGKVIAARVDSLQQDPRSKEIASRISKRLFTETLAEKDQAAVAAWLYDLYSIQFSLVIEMQQAKVYFDFGKAFTKEDLQWLDKINSAADFLEKGAGLDPLGIQSRIAAPLLLDLVTTTDALTRGRLRKDAVLRFSHAEAISPLATLMGIPEASVPSASIYDFDKHWKAANIIPLSANIQWIIYGNGKKYLVKVLLNEREVALPVKTTNYPYYKWEDVKSYYLTKLKKIGVKPGDDMHKFLLNIK
ncbi:histidine-type phosphatase [Chitinophaga sancti]|uniref:Multiple inositol polyphosphate phosphatase 1 n=1 Tax=Chitinophaga sancti TaxID=1004 RepID=A0A1K1QWF4_9BACT|nr:histidine-type phosphatase [Chitinophaga sancti]WQD62017.1 histidine-type phosphatase [Chitinophaga sancti]WQG92414.1 histidine-type phosphatase [Chitinophaga sancti]SFW64215.1 Histidine phosphatase superfamily (branch 2) [Chitinophaga sancti]